MLTKFFTKKIPRAIELKNIVKNYFETSSKSSKVCSSKNSKSKRSTSQKSSRNSSSSSPSKSVHLNAEAEPILSQIREWLERKAKLLEQQQPLEVEIEKEKIFEA